MAVAAPPRPPTSSPDPEALIEEARQRQRRRRLLGLCIVAAAIGLGLGLGLGFSGGGGTRPRRGSTPGGRPAGSATRAREVAQIARAATHSFIGEAAILGGGRGWAMNGLALYWTEDNGTHWRVITPPRAGDVIARVADIASADSRHVWVSLSDITGTKIVNGSDRHMEIARTDDGGRTWHVTIPPGCYGCGPAHLSFLDARHGFALTGAPERLFTTTDGGASWHPVAGAPFSGQIEFVTPKIAWGLSDPRAWVGPSYDRPVGGGVLYRTRDGGLAWSRVELPVPAALNGQASIAELPRFFGTKIGVVAVRFRNRATRTQHLVVYTTRDGGSTWSPRSGPAVDLEALQWGVPGVLPFAAADSSRWFLFLGPALYTTADAGRSWKKVMQVYAPDAGNIEDVMFVSPSTGWAIFLVHDGAALMRTTDGGKTWAPLSPPPVPVPR